MYTCNCVVVWLHLCKNVPGYVILCVHYAWMCVCLDVCCMTSSVWTYVCVNGWECAIVWICALGMAVSECGCVSLCLSVFGSECRLNVSVHKCMWMCVWCLNVLNYVWKYDCQCSCVSMWLGVGITRNVLVYECVFAWKWECKVWLCVTECESVFVTVSLCKCKYKCWYVVVRVYVIVCGCVCVQACELCVTMCIWVCMWMYVSASAY